MSIGCLSATRLVAAVVLSLATGCSGGAVGPLGDDGGAAQPDLAAAPSRDLAPIEDLAPPPDLVTPPDLTPPPDLVTPLDLTPFMTASHPSWPLVHSGGAAVLAPITLVSIVATGDAVGSRFLDFGDQLVASQWWSAVGADYALGAAQPNVRVTGPAITNNVSRSDMEAYINGLITAQVAPAPNGNTIYMLYLPDGIVAILDNGQLNTKCGVYEGYHLQLPGYVDNWAFAQRCLHNTQAGIDDATNTGSHEVIEAATDPTSQGFGAGAASGQPWNDDVWTILGGGANTEVADLCLGTIWTEGGFQYQRVWSTSAAALGGDPCVPTIPDPYYNTSPDLGWYPVTAGTSIDITLTAWSTAPTGDWYLDWSESAATGGTWQEGITANRTFTYQGSSYAVVNNGETATLTVTAPATAASGSYDELSIYSEPMKATATGDAYHVWPIGIYVP
jgi:hypothetical protein